MVRGEHRDDLVSPLMLSGHAQGKADSPIKAGRGDQCSQDLLPPARWNCGSKGSVSQKSGRQGQTGPSRTPTGASPPKTCSKTWSRECRLPHPSQGGGPWKHTYSTGWSKSLRTISKPDMVSRRAREYACSMQQTRVAVVFGSCVPLAFLWMFLRSWTRGISPRSSCWSASSQSVP